ncbi:hypothetical protein [Parendozoicomonas haliclonae]|uniref:Uncharacterized protein n=1 Tax=Parendozoicomonas haliclonae TaxID=1960125 RepID=A0A1X7AHH5_9GAMM|nr:hypothetical protein [Parendozoicomonas haliclonae]SMA41577.1 hypothetical protein EHSB41UT_01274 [Parendozoicomonas haliclonae]
MTPEQRRNWIHRIHNFEHNAGNIMRKQLLLNGYKYFVKALFLVFQMQLPEGVQLGFQVYDMNNRLDSFTVWQQRQGWLQG